MPRLIILDLGGVQVFRDRKLHAQSCSQLLYDSGFSLSPEDYYKAFHNYYIPYSLGKYSSDAEFYHLVLGDLGVPFNIKLAKELHNLYYQSFGQYPQIPRLLHQLRQRYPLFLLTNQVNHWADFILDKFRLKGFYQYQVVSQSAGFRKPDPEIFRMALRLANMDPQDCVFFDDKQENVRTAQSFGMVARQVDPSQGLTFELVSDILE